MSAIEASHAIIFDDVSKFYGEILGVNRINLAIAPGITSLVGPNGSGKTTLVNVLTGELPPDSGTVKLGSNLAMATLDQKRESLDPNWTLADALTGGGGDTVVIGEEKRHVIGYMRDFLFSPEQARTPVTALSGGERGRLTLARALAKPSNVLVLDEPTNDLDLETLDVLEEMLSGYNGTIILISHDRDFLDRVVNSVLVPEGNGRWTEYAGGYEDMLRQRGRDILQKDIVRKAEAPKAAPKKKPAAAPERAAQKRKLSYNEKYALETLPQKIKTLEESVHDLQKRLDDPELFSRDRKAFDATTMALGKAQDELAAAEEQWLALEIAREPAYALQRPGVDAIGLGVHRVGGEVVCLDVNGSLLPVVCHVQGSRLDRRDTICQCPEGARTDASVCAPGERPPSPVRAPARDRQ